MNENDKILSPESEEKVLSLDNTVPGDSSVAENVPCNSEENADVCVETESPALEISEAADAFCEDKNIRQLNKEELIAELKNIVDSEKFGAAKMVTALKQRFYFLRNAEIEAEMQAYLDAGNPIDAFAAMPDPMETEFHDLLNVFKEKRAAFLASAEEKKAENLEFKQKILAQMKSLTEDIDNVNLHFPKFKQLQQDFKSITDIPDSAVTETWKTFQEVVETFYDRFKMNKELRDLDFKKNLEIKKGIIEEAKSLEEQTDVVAAERRLQELHASWRETGPVAKELRDEIWEEFKAASTVINKRHQAFFEERKATEKANEDAKTALCEKIEAIDIDSICNFSEWEEKTKEIIALQAEWKTLGFASRKANNVLFARFRKSCDDFFAKKAEAYKKTKDELSNNLELKTSLCERAEALKETAEIKDGVKKILELQEEWKKIGPVPRKYNESIWNRFRAACNYFFDERRKQNATVRKSEMENLAAKKEIIAALKAVDLEKDKSLTVKEVKELQSRWQAIGFVPFKEKETLQKEYRSLLDDIYGKLDVKFTRDRLSRFQERISSGEGTADREREKLQRALESRRNELKTYENNLGFFSVKSREGNQMFKEMERKMDRLKSEIEEIKQKINLINSEK